MYVTVATINIVHGSWQHHLGHLHSCKYNLSVAPQPHGRPAGSIPGAEAVTLRAYQRLHDELQDAATLQVGGATRTSNLIVKHGAGCGL